MRITFKARRHAEQVIVACQVSFHVSSLFCWRYLVEGGFELLSSLSSSNGRSDNEACGTRTHRGPRVPVTQAVGDGRNRPALILIPVVCCMLRWMFASWRSSWATHSNVPTLAKCIQPGLLGSLLKRFHRLPRSRTTCLLDIAWLGNLAGQGAVPVAGVHISCTYMVTLALQGDTLV